MSQSNATQSSSNDSPRKKLIELVVRQEKSEQRLVELEEQADKLERNDKNGKSKW